MLVLLPPSEGKTAPRRGRPVDLTALSFPDLSDTRRLVLDALVSLCSGPVEPARQALRLPIGLAAAVERNAALHVAPAAPAARIYSGVLYAALDLATLDAAALRRARRWLAIASGLWGFVGVTDRIPAYRLSPPASLPGIGALSSFWRPALTATMPEAVGSGLLVDLRSGAYTGLWHPRGDLVEQTLTVRVLTESAGRRTVISHDNKATKGLLVRALLQSAQVPRTPDDLAGILGAAGWRVEVASPTSADGWRLDVVLRLSQVVGNGGVGS